MTEQIFTQLKAEVFSLIGNGLILVFKGIANFFIILVDLIKSFL